MHPNGEWSVTALILDSYLPFLKMNLLLLPVKKIVFCFLMHSPKGCGLFSVPQEFPLRKGASGNKCGIGCGRYKDGQHTLWILITIPCLRQAPIGQVHATLCKMPWNPMGRERPLSQRQPSTTCHSRPFDLRAETQRDVG